MMDKLFQVQDVARISNIKKSDFTEKRINEIASPYKSTPAGSRAVQHNSKFINSSVHPDQHSEEESKHKSEIDKYIAELGEDGADFAAFKKLCNNRKSLAPFRKGRLTRLFCCRSVPFDKTIIKAK